MGLWSGYHQLMEIEEQVYHQMNKIRRNSRDQGKLESNCLTFKFDLKQLYKAKSKQSKGENDYESMTGAAMDIFGENDQMKKIMGTSSGDDHGGSIRDQMMGDRNQMLNMMQMMGAMNHDQMQRVMSGEVVAISDDQVKKMMQKMMSGDNRDDSDREDQLKKMMQMMNGEDRENSMKNQMMSNRDQMLKMMQIMSNSDNYNSIKDKMNEREHQGSTMGKAKEMGNNMSLDEMMEMMDVDIDQMQNMMEMMHNGDDYSMKENLMHMMNNQERRENDNENRYKKGQYQNYRNRSY